MPLVKYKLLQASTEHGVVHLPEKMIPIGVMPDAETGAPSIVLLMKYPDWAEEFPDEAAAEAKEEEKQSAQ